MPNRGRFATPEFAPIFMSQMTSVSISAKWYRRLHWQVLWGLLGGVGFGLLAVRFGWQDWARDWVTPFGVIFMNLLKLVALPMVVFSLINGISSIGDTRQLTRLGGRAILWFMSTMMVAVALGLAFATFMRPGDALPKEAGEQLLAAYQSEVGARDAVAQKMQTQGPLRILVDAVPDNFFGALGDNGRMLQVVLGAMLIGFTMVQLPRKQVQPLIDFCDSAGALFMKLAHNVAMLSPFGVFALITGTIVALSGDDPSQALRLLQALALYVVTVVAALAFHQFVVYSLIIKFVAKRSPREFFRGIAPAQSLAFSTSSTSAALPVTIECCEKNLGVPRHISRFVLPLAATINMDGSALFQAAATVFIAQALGVDLTAAQYGILFGATMIGGVGTAPVPGASMVMMVMVLTMVGLPVEGLALIIGVDRIVNMCRATVNAVGDSVIAVLLSGYPAYEAEGDPIE